VSCGSKLSLYIARAMPVTASVSVSFRPGVEVGKDLASSILLAEHAAVVLAGGAEQPRDLPVPGRDLAGIHFAMEFLPQQNRVVAGDRVPDQIVATGKRVVVIGGGDTGSDCVGTSNRQRAKSVTQFELLPQPPEHEDKPRSAVLAGQAAHVVASGSTARSAGHQAFEGRNGGSRSYPRRVAEGRCGQLKMVEMFGTEFEMKADSKVWRGFLGPVHTALLAQWSNATRAAMRGYPTTIDVMPRASAAATCAAASRWWSGRSAKAGSARARSTCS
jgi:glutamate synthase (NADPH/NADH) small chain